MIYINKIKNYDFSTGESECLNILMPRDVSYWSKVALKKREIKNKIEELSIDKRKNRNEIEELKNMKRLITDRAIVNIKTNLVNFLLIEQRGRCYYCEGKFFLNRLGVGDPTIDHIVDKGTHPEHLFDEMNLVLACRTCNGFTKKGTKPTLNCNGKSIYNNYISSDFKIVHPYIDNKSDHLEYCEDYNIWKSINNSEKGKNTIEMFEFDQPYYVIEKYRESLSKVTVNNEIIIDNISGYVP